jgi:DNA gyrase subunit A
VTGDETVIAATREGRALLCDVDEVSYLSGPGKGVLLVKLDGDDALIGMKAVKDDRDTLLLETSLGGEQRINTGKYEKSSRGGKGREIIKRGKFVKVVLEPPQAPQPLTN